MKRCYKCGETKPPSMFSADKSRADGLQPRCKSCYAEYKRSRRKPPRPLQTEEEKKAKLRAWRAANREKHTLQAAEWRKRNPEKVEMSIARYREANGERLKALRKIWSIENEDRIREKNRKHRLANPGKYAEHAQRRNATKLKATPKWANIDVIRSVYDAASKMTSETGESYHVDHIVPLRSKIVCGLHCEFNLQILPASKNTSKGNRYWPDMP